MEVAELGGLERSAFSSSSYLTQLNERVSPSGRTHAPEGRSAPRSLGLNDRLANDPPSAQSRRLDTVEHAAER